MDVVISDARIDQLIAEDVPYIDLTTQMLGISDKPARIEFFTREDATVCATEEAARVLQHLGAEVESLVPSGEHVAAGTILLVAVGPAGAMHKAWKVCLNLLDHCSAVATKTHNLVSAAKSANPACEVLTTRKSMPGVKDLLTKAATAGGAFPHRLGLSETVLVFDNHTRLMGGFDAFLDALPSLRSKCIEKKLFVEADADQARALARAGVDGIQFDKIPADELAALVAELRAINPHCTLIAAGGINAKNAAAYAATGVDGLATTAPFSAAPLDMSARILPA